MPTTDRLATALTIICAQLPWLGLYVSDQTLVLVGVLLTALGGSAMLRLWLQRVAPLEGGAWGVLQAARWGVLIAAISSLAALQLVLLLTVFRPN